MKYTKRRLNDSTPMASGAIHPVRMVFERVRADLIHGRQGDFCTPLYVLLVITHTKQTWGACNDSTAHG